MHYLNKHSTIVVSDINHFNIRVIICFARRVSDVFGVLVSCPSHFNVSCFLLSMRSQAVDSVLLSCFLFEHLNHLSIPTISLISLVLGGLLWLHSDCNSSGVGKRTNTHWSVSQISWFPATSIRKKLLLRLLVFHTCTSIGKKLLLYWLTSRAEVQACCMADPPVISPDRHR